MALQLAEVLTAARGRHPAFEPRAVPNASLARFLTGYQRDLVSRAMALDRSFLAQQASVAFDVAAANAVGVAGAGTAGGLPVRVAAGVPSVVQRPVGSAAELDTDEDVTVHYGEKPVTGATANTLSYAGATWTTNEHQNRTVVITGGTGQGQRRTVASNTAAQVTTTQDWATLPDTTSLFKIVTGTIEDNDTFGAVAASPFTASRVGYLVRLNPSGVAYLDLTQPLVATFAVGIPLPPHHFLIGGTVRFTDPDDGEAPLALVSYGDRYHARADYAAYVQGGELYLVGDGDDWQDVASLDLRYVPIAPALTALTDYFLLPDAAYQALVDGAAYHAALRVQGAVGVPRIDASALLEAKVRSEGQWLREVSLQRRGRIHRLKGH